jgi:hypothetical protein
MADANPLDPQIDGRDPRGRFQPGRSGNPAGKKPGTLNHATWLKRRLEGEDFETVAEQLIEAARAGHGPSVRFVMERLVPKGRGRAIELDLPRDASRAGRGAAIVAAMCAGEISPDEAKIMLAVLATADAIPDAAVDDTESAAAPDMPGRDAADAAPTARAETPMADRGAALSPGVDLHSTCISPRPSAEAPTPSRHRGRERERALAA